MPRNRKFVAALSALSMAAVLSAIDQTVVSTALPHIIDSLQGAQLLEWVFTAYFLSATATVTAHLPKFEFMSFSLCGLDGRSSNDVDGNAHVTVGFQTLACHR